MIPLLANDVLDSAIYYALPRVSLVAVIVYSIYNVKPKTTDNTFFTITAACEEQGT